MATATTFAICLALAVVPASLISLLWWKLLVSEGGQPVRAASAVRPLWAPAEPLPAWDPVWA